MTTVLLDLKPLLYKLKVSCNDYTQMKKGIFIIFTTKEINELLQNIYRFHKHNN